MKSGKFLNEKLPNWRQIGVTDKPIYVPIRPPNSGMHLYWKEHILEGEAYGKNVKTAPKTSSPV